MDLQWEIFCDHSSTLIFEWIYLSVAGKNDTHKSFNELELRSSEQDTFYPSLVLVQPRKTHPCLIERLLMERKESNQTKLADNQDWHNILCFLISSWSLFQVQSYLPLSIINYGISKHYAGSQVSDRCSMGYLYKSYASAQSGNPDQS